MSIKLSDKQIQHLYWRAGFGISSSELSAVRSFSKKKLVAHIFEQSKNVNELQLDLKPLQREMKTMTQEAKKKLRMLQTQKLQELNLRWYEQLQTSKGVLRERMTLFFHNHFSVRLRAPQLILPFHNTIRRHALGNFGDLLMEVSRSPAMLRFLNNQQNRKRSPNENFARELMELFTLGRDNGYTESDIKEAARAFTGWGFNKEGSFVFRQNQHDTGSKTFLGKTGNFKGTDIIQILLEQKQTARYLVQKIYKGLVSDQLDKERVEELTTVFYDSNYDIESLLKAIFLSEWFYSPEYIGVKIKSPVELITGLGRQFGIEYERPKVLLFAQNKLNQILFYPPNVAGWPGGRYWIDSSTLMLRLKLASVMLNNGIIDLAVKDNMPENKLMQDRDKNKKKGAVKRKGLANRFRINADWEQFLTTLETRDKSKLTDFLIQPELSVPAQKIIGPFNENNTKNLVVELLSLPEYQLC